MRFTIANTNAVDQPTRMRPVRPSIPARTRQPGQDDVAEAHRGVGGDGEVDRCLQRRQLARSPEDDGPESDLDQMEEDDEHEEEEEEPGAATHVRGLEDLTDRASQWMSRSIPELWRITQAARS